MLYLSKYISFNKDHFLNKSLVSKINFPHNFLRYVIMTMYPSNLIDMEFSNLAEL